MLGTVELQVKTATFLATQVAKYRTTAWCPPAALYGVQLQRVRFGAAVIRQTVPQEFTVLWRNSYGDLVPTVPSATGFKTQLDLQLEFDITTQQAIADNPGAMPPDQLVLRPHVIFDLYVVPSEIDGCTLVMARSAVEWPPGSAPDLPPGLPPLPPGTTPQSLLDPMILAMLPSVSVPVNLGSGAFGTGAIINAGLAADATGNRLVLRAESFQLNDNPNRWTYFHHGEMIDRLGNADWSLFLKAVDISQLLNISLWDGLRDAIGSTENAHIISCATDYSPGNGSATFTTTVYLRVTAGAAPDFTEEIPLATTFSLDAATGGIAVEVWLKGIEDFVDDATTVFNVAMIFVPPVLAIPLGVMFGDGRSYLENELNGVTPPGIDSLKFSHVTPYLLRATMPIPSPKLLGPGATVTELVADDDGFSLQGTWPLATLSDSNLTIQSDGFEWRGPEFSCGQASHGIGQQIRDDPGGMIRATASVVLGQTGQLPITLCSARLTNAPADLGPQVKLGFVAAAQVPTTVSLAAPASWANAHADLPITLELRTSNGVLDVVIPPSGMLSQGVIDVLAGAAEIRVRLCERVLPDAFEKIRNGEKFNVDWIVDPLVDPPRPEGLPKAGDLELWTVRVAGLTAGQRLFLGNEANSRMRGAQANSMGQLRLAAVFAAGDAPVLSGAITQVAPGLGAAPLRSSIQKVTSLTEDPLAPGIEVFRQRYVLGGRLLFGRPLRDLVAMPGLGRGRFAALVGEHVIDIAAGDAWSPEVLASHFAEGARGLLALRDGVLAYGGCGAMVFKPDGSRRWLGEHGDEVLGAALVGEQVALLRLGVLDTLAMDGGCQRRTQAIEAAAIAEYAGQLLVAGPNGLSACRGVDLAGLQALPLQLPALVTSLKSVGGAVLAQLSGQAWVRLDLRTSTVEPIDGLPWELKFATGTGVAAALSEDGRGVDFHAVQPARGATPSPAGTDG